MEHRSTRTTVIHVRDPHRTLPIHSMWISEGRDDVVFHVFSDNKNYTAWRLTRGGGGPVSLGAGADGDCGCP